MSALGWAVVAGSSRHVAEALRQGESNFLHFCTVPVILIERLNAFRRTDKRKITATLSPGSPFSLTSTLIAWGWGTSFSGGHVIQAAAHGSRVRAVVGQVGAMDVGQIIPKLADAEMFTGLQQLTVQGRIRHATEGGEKYIPNSGRSAEGFALQADQGSFDFAHHAQATVAPA
jgi:hypothetical protein